MGRRVLRILVLGFIVGTTFVLGYSVAIYVYFASRGRNAVPSDRVIAAAMVTGCVVAIMSFVVSDYLMARNARKLNRNKL